jgi:phosphohistidine phosphatase
MKTVVICRHAKSDWSQDLADFDRPLNSRGEVDAPMMGKVLAQSGFMPDLILTSPANRAKTTAHYVAKALRYSQPIREEQGIYHQGATFILDLLSNLPDSVQSVMVFGHNPTLESVVGQLLGTKGHITMPTAAMACLTHWSNRWKEATPGQFGLQWHLIPKLIKGSVR